MMEQREHPYSSESSEEMLAMHQTSIYKSWMLRCCYIFAGDVGSWSSQRGWPWTRKFFL